MFFSYSTLFCKPGALLVERHVLPFYSSSPQIYVFKDMANLVTRMLLTDTVGPSLFPSLGQTYVFSETGLLKVATPCLVLHSAVHDM